MKKVIVRLKGGLGNQLFCYAVARRLAIHNNAELVIDNFTGFIRDSLYKRQYSLGCFNIQSRFTTKFERMEPFERLRRGLNKYFNQYLSFSKRTYLENEGFDFDERILSFHVDKCVYLDGLWFSEKYFLDVEQYIRQDLQITPPTDLENQTLFSKINNCNSIAVHVRWFNDPNFIGEHNATVDYYQNAFDYIEQRVDNPHYFVFSDDPVAAKNKINFPLNHTTFINHNSIELFAYADLWLMSHCKHFIIANSTFSWWGAWLSNFHCKIVVSPNISVTGLTGWGFEGLIPDNWIKL